MQHAASVPPGAVSPVQTSNRTIVESPGGPYRTPIRVIQACPMTVSIIPSPLIPGGREYSTGFKRVIYLRQTVPFGPARARGRRLFVVRVPPVWCCCLLFFHVLVGFTVSSRLEISSRDMSWMLSSGSFETSSFVRLGQTKVGSRSQLQALDPDDQVRRRGFPPSNPGCDDSECSRTCHLTTAAAADDNHHNHDDWHTEISWKNDSA